METEKGFIVNSSYKDDPEKDFIWFVRHEDVLEGKPQLVAVGKLEDYIKEKRKELSKK